jgi:hypothetical protein
VKGKVLLIASLVVAVAITTTASSQAATTAALATPGLSLKEGKRVIRDAVADVSGSTGASNWRISNCYRWSTNAVQCWADIYFGDGGECGGGVRATLKRDGYIYPRWINGMPICVPGALPPGQPPTPPSPPPPPTPPACHPSYTGACLDPNAYDYDCLGGSGNGPLYTGPVTVVGTDTFGLDADGDGIGCE